MYEITRMPSYINLGNQGEAEVKTIEINIAPWQDLYPDADFGVSYVRPREDEPVVASGVTV